MKVLLVHECTYKRVNFIFWDNTYFIQARIVEVYASIETQKISKSPKCNIWLINTKGIKEIQFY